MPGKTAPDPAGKEQLLPAAERERELRQQGYREKALKLFPWICARCGRDFSGRKVRDLTVHHKDHNHDNNPADGSNWELLCLYCHDNEHGREAVAEACAPLRAGAEQGAQASHSPFSGLASLLDRKK